LLLLGTNLLEQNKPAAAEPVLRQALAILQSNPEQPWDTVHAQSRLGAALLGTHKYADAEPLLRQAVQAMKEFDREPVQKRRGPPLGQRRVDALESLVQLYEAWGKPGEAAEWRKELAAYLKAPQIVKPTNK
jgi:hypothetical protein